MKYKTLTFFLLMIYSDCISQQPDREPINFMQKRIQDGGIRLSYHQVKMPAGEANLGLMGLHSHFEFLKKLYAGIGMYSSVTGERGGLFTLQISAGLKQRIFHSLFLDLNMVWGGGGGGHSPVGGGEFINPKMGIYFNKSGFLMGAHYSYFNFYSGDIASSGFSYFMELPLKLKYAPYNKMNQYAIHPGKEPEDSWNEEPALCSFICRLDNFFPLENSEYTFGEKIKDNVHLVGFEYNHFFKNRQTFLSFQVDGAYKGYRAGFMDLFGGIGANLLDIGFIHIQPKISVGAGGGGRIQTGGGLLIYPTLCLQQKINNHYFITEHIGYLFNPPGSFKTLTAGISLKHDILFGGTINPLSGTRFNSFHFQGLQFIIENQTYHKAALQNMAPVTTQLLSLQMNADMMKWFYIAGQTAFAYLGQSGGYAEGLFGVGYHSTPLFREQLQFIFNGMIGIGGGGNIPTAQGFIIKPGAGIKYYLGEHLALSAGFGKVYSPYGILNSWSFSGGLVYAFSLLTAK